MIRKFLISFQLIFLYFVVLNVNAKPLADSLVEQASHLKLANNPAWLALLHYRKDTIGSGFTSEADDVRFFLSANGKESPEEELFANIRSFFSVDERHRKKQCQFPARYHWIKSQLNPDTFVNNECEETNKWLAELEPRSMTLIFPASYINSPSSMFGHTLLRVNLLNEKSKNPLTGYSISYAANVPPNEIGLLFAYRGFFGGYEGEFAIVPYYKKIKEYSELENRDIWEYELNLTAEESRQILRHVWELKDIIFEYYFFTENCSYQLLTLLEVVRPELKLREKFNYKAIPADTVRAVVNTGIVEKTVYRPSGTTILLNRNRDLSTAEKAIVKDLILGEEKVTELIKSLTPESKSKVLEYSYDYFRYKFSKAPGIRDNNASRSYELLRLRSSQDEPANWHDIKEPEIRDDQGHETSRFAVGVGQENNMDYLSLKIRPAYHDVLDPLPGYGFGAQINFLDLSLKYFSEPEKLEFDKLTFINISSMTPSTDFISTVSWAADVYAERKVVNNTELDVLAVKAGGGKSFLLSRHNMISFLAEGVLETEGDLEDGYSLGAGVMFEWLIAADWATSKLKLESIDFRAGEEYRTGLAEWQVSLHLSKKFDLRFKVSREKNQQLYDSQYEAALHWYY